MSNYNAYLQTDYWIEVSRLVKQRAGYRCQICNSPHDLQAHHRTYANRGREMDHLDDLTCLCRRCHAVFHGREEVTVQRVVVEEMIEVTAENCHTVRMNKETWHWMKTHGVDPKRSGWKRRMIGRLVPARFIR